MKKRTIVILGIALAASIAVSAASLGYNVRQSARVNRFITNQLKRQAKEEEKKSNYQEDGYKVSDQYEIRSTKDISDAYKSGDDSKLSDTDKETLKTASDILKKIIRDGDSDYQKELAVYEWMFENIGQGQSTVVTLPAASGSDFTPQGVLVSKQAVCVGYATTFRMFMQMLGMDCHIVHNDYHSWDLVKLDDGNWYHVDIYTDVSGKSEFQNFNMTDATAKASHEWDTAALPAADGVKYTYAVQNNTKVSDLTSVVARVKKEVDKKASERKSQYFSFEKKYTADDLGKADAVINGLNAALQNTGLSQLNISGAWYNGENDSYILGVFISDYSSTNGGTTLTKKEKDRLSAAISKAFGVEISDDQLGISVTDAGNGEGYNYTYDQQTGGTVDAATK
ncbi:MAG: transglutaminase-like domain-containing protein [Lachnospiraceae bacterium]|nr:transglutaminase-like domain-containing protein [Lachnospiraceae bacterium]MDD7327831.1 transglutaminase-like domain-containing protein [Lachnospiraceae bacterium]MDY2760101.1 transglutaminase-like domain-containing protein [Lachnospiraceae bacterium]